jgi:hypothetical protein
VEWDQTQTKLTQALVAKEQLTRQVTSLLNRCETLESENAKLADIADSVAQETKLIQEQHSNDKALLLEANEAAIREKDWFGSLYSKSRDAGDSSKLDTNTRAHAYTTTQPQLFSRRTTSQIEDIHSN